jgi:hypothetical protein
MLAAHNTLVESIAERRAAAAPASFGMVAGRDAHTLRRVGLTWTAAPGRNREEFLTSLRQGLGRPGGLHGTATTVAGDAYGVIGRYLASLAGRGPRDHAPLRRAACLAFAGATLPFEFMPLAVAMAVKAREGRQVAHARAHLAAGSPAGSAMQMEAVMNTRIAITRHRAVTALGTRGRAGAACSRANAASVRLRSSTPRDTAAAWPRKSTWTRSTATPRRSIAGAGRAAIGLACTRPARR